MVVIFYGLAVLVWVALLYPYLSTVFMAGCFACFSLPYYRRLRARKPGLPAIFLYTGSLVVIIMVPLLMLAVLVTPQALAGFNMLKRLRASSFQLPEHWLNTIDAWKSQLITIPGLGGWITDFGTNLEAALNSIVRTLLSGGVGVVGGTMTALWLLFLFVTFSVLGVVYAERFWSLTQALTRLPVSILQRFVLVIRGALGGVFLGVLLVALAQGILCGIGFAVAGVAQPAFWGLLATFVAPIPLVGTAIVWIPLCLVLWFSGSMGAAIGLAVWGMLAVAGIDNVLRPLFLKRGINAPLFVLVLAILCGLATFGPMGLVLGPVIVAFSVQAVHEADCLMGRCSMYAWPHEEESEPAASAAPSVSVQASASVQSAGAQAPAASDEPVAADDASRKV